eukprot:Lankesteria_metandrocarpae@DN5393_c0_g1_i1.p2
MSPMLLNRVYKQFSAEMREFMYSVDIYNGLKMHPSAGRRFIRELKQSANCFLQHSEAFKKYRNSDVNPRLVEFGSHKTNLCLPWSDVDLAITNIRRPAGDISHDKAANSSSLQNDADMYVSPRGSILNCGPHSSRGKRYDYRMDVLSLLAQFLASGGGDDFIAYRNGSTIDDPFTEGTDHFNGLDRRYNYSPRDTPTATAGANSVGTQSDGCAYSQLTLVEQQADDEGSSSAQDDLHERDPSSNSSHSDTSSKTSLWHTNRTPHTTGTHTGTHTGTLRCANNRIIFAKVIQAAVPILTIKGLDGTSPVDSTHNYGVVVHNVDISVGGVEKHRGIEAAQLIECYMEVYPTLRPVALLLKQLMRHRGVNRVFLGGLSSYSLLLMIIAFLQVPHLYDDRHNDPGAQLLNLLCFYGGMKLPSEKSLKIPSRNPKSNVHHKGLPDCAVDCFDYTEMRVNVIPLGEANANGALFTHTAAKSSLRNGHGDLSTVRSPTHRLPYAWRHDSALLKPPAGLRTPLNDALFCAVYICDPLDASNNVSRSTYNIAGVKDAFATAAQAVLTTVSLNLDNVWDTCGDTNNGQSSPHSSRRLRGRNTQIDHFPLLDCNSSTTSGQGSEGGDAVSASVRIATGSSAGTTEGVACPSWRFETNGAVCYVADTVQSSPHHRSNGVPSSGSNSNRRGTHHNAQQVGSFLQAMLR